MINHPFRIFESYRDKMDVRLFTKADAVSSAEDLARHLDTSDLVSLKQVHGNTVVIAEDASKREMEADAVMTNQPDLWLTIRTADCQQILVYAPEQNAIGLIHAGWKGLVNGVIPAFFEKMKIDYEINPSTVIVAAGPSLCTKCAEFTDPTTELTGIDPRFFHGRNADLRAIADDQLMQCGVTPNHMERHPDCTKCKSDRYWSYRGGDKEAVIKGSSNVLTCMLKSRQ